MANPGDLDRDRMHVDNSGVVHPVPPGREQTIGHLSACKCQRLELYILSLCRRVSLTCDRILDYLVYSSRHS